jgi:hypothetical protein
MQEVEDDNAPKLYWFELFFCNSLYLLVYTLTLRVGIILGHRCPDPINLQNVINRP